MLAAQVGGPGGLVVTEVPLPKPGDGEMLVRVGAASICGTDLRILQNGLPGVSQAAPRILGHEFAGDVAEVGKGVSGIKPGDRVAVAPNIGCGHCDMCTSGNSHHCGSHSAIGITLDGGFAEYVLIPKEAVAQGNVIALPPGMTYPEASIAEALACCWHGFEACRISPGEVGLVIGAGPIGVAHSLIMRMAGASCVVMADISQSRLDLAASFGPDVTVNSATESLEAVIHHITGGKGADVVIVACPSPEAQAQALTVAGVGGRINYFGGLPQRTLPVALDTNLIHYKELIVTGTTRSNTRQFRMALRLIETGRFPARRLVTGTYPLSEAPSAFEAAASGRHMKVVIEPGGH